MSAKHRIIISAAAMGVIAVLTMAAPRPARASVFEALIGLGDDMAPYLDDKRTSEKPRSIIINGQQLWVSVGRTAHAAARVKDWYLDRYRQEELTKLARERGVKAPPTEVTFGDDLQGGMVAFDLGGKLSPEVLRKRFFEFARTRRIGELGQIRFVRWQREAGGETRFLRLWSDQHFSLDGMMPPRGVDVAGGDLPGVVRPPGMTRVLAIEEEGKPYRTRVYEGLGVVPQVAASVALGMQQRGWLADRSYGQSDDHKASLRFDREGRSVIFAIDESEHGLVEVAIIERGRL
jgi:hypothetical protein